MHLTDDNTLESILERQSDGLVERPVEELGCITVGAGTSVLSLWNNKRQNTDSSKAPGQLHSRGVIPLCDSGLLLHFTSLSRMWVKITA